MKLTSTIMIWLVVASLVCGETTRAANLGNRGKTVVNKIADAGGLGRFRELRTKLASLPRGAAAFFAPPADGGYSPVRKTVAAGALALTCWWSTAALTGCVLTKSSGETKRIERLPNGETKVYVLEDGTESQTEAFLVGAVVVIGVTAAVIYLAVQGTKGYYGIPNQRYPNQTGIQQHRLSRDNLIDHSMSIDNETYRGVLITYRDGVDTRTGLAFSPNAPLVFSAQNSEQGMLGFLNEDPDFQPPARLTIKHLDGETPDAVINLTQVENVLLQSEGIASQELFISE